MDRIDWIKISTYRYIFWYWRNVVFFYMFHISQYALFEFICCLNETISEIKTNSLSIMASNGVTEWKQFETMNSKDKYNNFLKKFLEKNLVRSIFRDTNWKVIVKLYHWDLIYLIFSLASLFLFSLDPHFATQISTQPICKYVWWNCNRFVAI